MAKSQLIKLIPIIFLEPVTLRLLKEANTRKISHNRIHDYLLSMNLARQESKKKKRRKWCRYEREHSMSAAHRLA